MRKLALLATLCAALVAGSAASAPAVVPPKKCKTITVRGDRIQVKADQITCKTAVRTIKNYARYGKRPKGWTCQKNPDSKLRWRCFKGRKAALGILRS